MTPEDVETLDAASRWAAWRCSRPTPCTRLGTDPDSREGVERLYRLKGRVPDKPSAVMFFQVDAALAALPELGPRTRPPSSGCCPEA